MYYSDFHASSSDEHTKTVRAWMHKWREELDPETNTWGEVAVDTKLKMVSRA